METELFKDKLFDYAKNNGIRECEIHMLRCKKHHLKVSEQKPDNFSVSETISLNIKGIYKGYIGKSYSERIDDLAIERIVNQIKNNAIAIKSEDENFHNGSGDYKDINEYVGEIEKIDIKQKIDYALTIEKKLRTKNFVINTNYCCYEDYINEVSIYNTNNLAKTFKNDFAIIMGDSVIMKNNEKFTGASFMLSKNKEEIIKGIDYVINDAYNKAISHIGSHKIKTGFYKVLFKNEIISELFSFYLPYILSAENVQKGTSFLKGKLNKRIAINKLTIYENPHLKNGFETRSFDDEGFPTSEKDIIKNGILITYLHNTKTAKKDGVKSTGNAIKDSFNFTDKILPTNIIIKSGNLSFEQLIEKCNNTLLITQIKGILGLDAFSGDFSLQIDGFMINDGVISFPIKEVAISGNFFDLLNNIEEIANDTKFGMPSTIKYRINSGTYYTPSILVSELSVSG